MVSFRELKNNLKKDVDNYPSVKLALVGDTATQFLVTAIKGMGVESGYNINLFEAEYNQVERQFMDPTSELYEFDADMIVVFQSTHKLGEHHSLLSIEQQLTLADDRLGHKEWFRDNCHFNEEGANLFSDLIANQISNLNIDN